MALQAAKILTCAEDTTNWYVTALAVGSLSAENTAQCLVRPEGGRDCAPRWREAGTAVPHLARSRARMVLLVLLRSVGASEAVEASHSRFCSDRIWLRW